MKLFKSSKKSRRIGLAVFLLSLVVIGLSSLKIKDMETKYSMMQFLPENDPAIAMDENVRQKFHLLNLPIFVTILTLGENEPGSWLTPERIQRASEMIDKIKALNGVIEVTSLTTANGAVDSNNAIQVGTLVKILPSSQWEQKIMTDHLLVPNLISKDQRTIITYVQLENANIDLLVSTKNELKKLMLDFFPGAQASVGGEPAVNTDLNVLLDKELINFLALTILACALTLFLLFRTFSTIVIPLLLTAFSNIMVFAAMAWTKLPFTVLSATIPILVFITVLSISVHFLLRLYEESNQKSAGPEEPTRWQLVWKVTKIIWLPNMLGALTTVVGFLTLLTNPVALIRNYGVSVALAIFISWLLTSLLLLPMTLLFPIPWPRSWVGQPAKWALWIGQHAKVILAVVLGFCVILSVSSRQLYWTGKLFDDLPKGYPSRESTETIDATLGGIVPLEITIRGQQETTWNDPGFIHKLDQLVDSLRKIKGVGSALSIPDFLKTVSGINSPLNMNSRAAIADLYFLFALSGHNPINKFLSEQDNTARIAIRLNDLPSQEAQDLLEVLKARTQQSFPSEVVELGGMGAIVHLIEDQISKNLISGFWQALGFIFILLAIIFRSLRWAVVACIPNLIPPLALLGFLSLTHTPIKPGVALIFSIALGLAFNNTVYVLNRLKKLKSLVQPLAVAKTFYLEGNPCLLSTCIMIAGFSVFLFSFFAMNQTFGQCIIVSIGGGILGDLILLPALLHLFPKLLA